VEGWTEWVFGPGFRLYSRFFVVSRSFLVVSFAGWRLLSELILHVTDNGWDLGDTEMTVRTRRRMGEEENRVLRTRWLGRSCGGKTAPTTTNPRN